MRKAIVIGINNYPDGAQLYGCIRDAEAFGKVIEKHGNGSRNFDVIFYKDVPTKDRLTEIVSELFAGKHEIALLYFAGHGTVNNLDSFLVTPDFKRFDPGLSLNYVMQMANESQSDNRVVILDCCHSGAAGTFRMMGGSASLLYNGVTILAASKADETSKEVDGGGIFTTLLVQALKGGAADICGNITPGSIYAYIDQALGAHDQRPVFKTNITTFTPLRNIKPLLDPDILRNITTYFEDPLKELPLNPSFEYTNSPEVTHLVIEPFARNENVAVFKELQQMESVGLVVPQGTPHMYWAAMEGRSCRLTSLGMHYWRLVKEGMV